MIEHSTPGSHPRLLPARRPAGLSRPTRLGVMLLAVLLVAACAQRGAHTVRPAPPMPIATAPAHPAQAPRVDPQNMAGAAALATGLDQYDHGQYDAAAETLQGALKLGLAPAAQVTAHKHLAFMHCLANRPGSCREEFRRALDIDPTFELRPSEAGHPMWGPVFRTTRAEQR